ncbi:baseplate multidomain protein megatron [Jannaschia pohangensis]|uniref:Putative phage tail protein n=1 Tax=Jannaschia pohangensis TaxID=390807 RepID=A0A1I3HRB6_9RHOB|nr:glycoside hydrolase TIM-barrel-like domain-containing protein [Jannaschia pohangensis]SFI38221.1 Putative phage tail protein [Jannaschia pohangensis]
MATLVLGAVGAAIGGSLGGSFLGLSAAVIGRAAGATVGRLIDQTVLGAGSDAVEHGRIDRLRISGASEGAAIPRVMGRTRIGGQIIWATRFKEHAVTTGGSGKGKPKAPQQTSYSYSVSFAVALCEGPITRIGRIWADGSEIARESLMYRVHAGDEDQLPDALIEAIEGPGSAPAYRGTAYVVIEDLDLAPFGNRIPNLSFEVVRHVDVPGEVPAPSQLIEGVALVPGTGEYSLSTTAVHYDHGVGEKSSANVNSAQGVADFKVSLDDLTEELPNLKSVSLVVSWFGDDLRVGECKLRPRAEQSETEGTPIVWNVAGENRELAGAVPTLDGRPVYGGTPSDVSVVESIRELNARGIDVTFYPFILMDQLVGNGLPDPYGSDEQPALPWRGRITTSLAPGQEGTPDRTAAARAEVDTFFGTTQGTEFSSRLVLGLGGSLFGPPPQMVYEGPENDWSYRRFILHYAKLCAAAGGGEAFCIGSEMRGLTQIRGEGDSFPAVEALRKLAEDVREILPDAKISYAADWSEYFGYQPSGENSRYFHLDALWSSPDIDFIGIDNYMPLADWRDTAGHVDAIWGSDKNISYLQSNIEGGEGFDWYYTGPDSRESQRRSPITDGAHEEPWIYRYKDIRSWWRFAHHDRIDGQRADFPTAWEPMSKPIRFIEYGCAAIDKGANQPNKFLDAKSSESSLPRFSTGRRDDSMQMQYYRAFLDYWASPERNGLSSVYDGAMLDLQHSFAWAWDTRPWPFFPELTDFWSDGENYARGHWLNGRSAQQPLSSVILKICRDAGLDDVDVSAVRGVVRGYSVGSVQSARSDLQPLMIANSVEVTERAGRIVFSMRAEKLPMHVDIGTLARIDEAVVKKTRGGDAEVSGRVIVHHVDANGDFKVRASDANLPGRDSVPVQETELALAMTQGEGHALAERMLAEAAIVRDEVSFSLAPSVRDVGVGDIVMLSDSNDLWRVDMLEDAATRNVKAVRTELGLFEPSDAVEDGSGRLRPLAPLPVDSLFLDLPLLTGEEVPHAPYVAVAAKPWPGSVAVYSSVEESNFVLDQIIQRPAVLGTTLTELAPACAGVWDRGDGLQVRLSGGNLASVTEAALFSGANAAAIGDGSSANWEVIQFRSAEPVANGVWALSARLRGQRGTEAASRSTWPVGSKFVLLDESLFQLNLSRSAVGLERNFLIGPASMLYDTEAYIHRAVTATGAGLRPYAPVHLRVAWSGSDLQFAWIRRSRTAVDNWTAGDIGLGELREVYLVRVIGSDGQVLWEKTTQEPKMRIDGSVLAGLSRPPFQLAVAQVSDDIGIGKFASISVPQ